MAKKNKKKKGKLSPLIGGSAVVNVKLDDGICMMFAGKVKEQKGNQIGVRTVAHNNLLWFVPAEKKYIGVMQAGEKRFDMTCHLL